MSINKTICTFILILFTSISCTKKFVTPITDLGRPDVSTLHGIKGTYSDPPRTADGRIDLINLLNTLIDLNCNTYNWLIWRGMHDWDDLQLFLPMAKDKGIKVWVTLVPPSESQPKFPWNSEPFQKDYHRWAGELAKLSLKYDNLVAWSIDDMLHNSSFYTKQYVEKMITISRLINPDLAFIPCLYYQHISKSNMENYMGLFDGVLFPYQAMSTGRNLKNTEAFASEMELLRQVTALPIFIDIYSTRHSSLGATTPAYVRELIISGRQLADGVFIYTHPDSTKVPEKYQVIKEEFQ